VRISDILGERVTAAIEALPVLSVIRQRVDWEIAPALLPRGDGMVLAYMVAVSLPVPGSVEADKVLYMAPLDDPDASQETVSALVESLYLRAQQEADQRRYQLAGQSGGHGGTPGELALP
jgi:hypothetical protein